jgi:Zinc knuckle
MIIKKLNHEFNSLMINLKSKLADAELRRAYANILKLGATAEQLRRIVEDATIFKVLIEMEDWENWSKEQEAAYYETPEKVSTPIITTSSESTPMNIGKRVKVCHYCKKPGYIIVDCRNKTAKINKISKEKKKEIRCYRCNQIEHMVKDCKVKIRIVNNLKEAEEANKASLQYFGPKRVKREVVSCWDCVKKELRKDCEKNNIVNP